MILVTITVWIICSYSRQGYWKYLFDFTVLTFLQECMVLLRDVLSLSIDCLSGVMNELENE